MIDEKTIHKNYPLPNPENRASQDVERIATALSMIDESFEVCEDKIAGIEELAARLDKNALRIPSEMVGKIDTEIKDVGARKYIVVNSDATGFTAVEGGGGVGGKKGEILAKKTDENFNTEWIDPRAVLKKAGVIENATGDTGLKNNSCIILADEYEITDTDLVPQQGINPHQIVEHSTLEAFHGYILKNKVEGVDDDLDLASKTTFGRIKIGDGFEVKNGVVSSPKTPPATKESLGVVQIGDNINVTKGVIDVPPVPKADRTTFGTVKLGTDFKIGDDDELCLTNPPKEFLNIVYQKAQVGIVQNNCIKIDAMCSLYRAFVDSDTLFTFDFSDFAQTADAAFDLEIVSYGTFDVGFSADIRWDNMCAKVTAGTSVIHFKKKIGDNLLDGNYVGVCNGIEPKLLTRSTEEDIQNDHIFNLYGCNANAYRFLTPVYSAVALWGVELYIDFAKHTYVSQIRVPYSRMGQFQIDSVTLYGSNDKKNWKQVGTCGGFKSGNFNMASPGFFKNYKIVFMASEFFYMELWGFDVACEDVYMPQKLIPHMASSNENGYIITTSGPAESCTTDLSFLTQVATNNAISFDTRDDSGTFWIKYKLPEPKVANYIDLGAGADDNRLSMSTWFKIEGSNDDVEWDLLFEHSTLEAWKTRETRQYLIGNAKAYKFYRFVSIEQGTKSNFIISRFRLYERKQYETLQKLIPPLTAPNDGGFEVLASSERGSGYNAYLAFDGDVSTKWSSAENDENTGWIQIKFPNETVCTNAWLTARNDDSYTEAPQNFEIQASNDGINFETLKSVTGETWSKGEEKQIEFFNKKSFLYYRIQSTYIETGFYFGLAELNFGALLKEYKRDLIRVEKITPNMSADAQDGYTITSSVANGTYSAYKAFSGKNEYDTDAYQSTSNEGWLQLELPSTNIVNQLKITGGQSGTEPETIKLYAGDDGENYTLLFYTDALTWTHNETKVFDVDNKIDYKFYKLEFSRNAGNVGIGEAQLIKITVTKEY